jgi:hypothetical protein
MKQLTCFEKQVEGYITTQDVTNEIPYLMKD